MRHRNLGVPPTEDGLFWNSFIFDYLFGPYDIGHFSELSLPNGCRIIIDGAVSILAQVVLAIRSARPVMISCCCANEDKRIEILQQQPLFEGLAENDVHKGDLCDAALVGKNDQMPADVQGNGSAASGLLHQASP